MDGNRNLTPELYRYYYNALHDLNVEYAEEPLQGGDWAQAMAVPWPVALDESLEEILDSSEPRPSLIRPMVNTIILKPGLLTGLHAMARCIADARLAGIKTVFSSSFNSGVTLANLGIFSRLAVIPPETAHGLDTLRYLEGDVLTPLLEIREGKLVIPDLFKTNESNYICHSREGGNPAKKELVSRLYEDDACIPGQDRNNKKEDYENVSIPESFACSGQILNSSVIGKEEPVKPSFILPSSIRLDRLFSTYATQTALITPAGTQTFDDVRKRLQNVMINLEKAGVRKGHCVAFYGENQELHLYLFLVSWMMNFLYMPLDFKAPLSRLVSERPCDFLITAGDLPVVSPKILRPADVMQDNHSLPETFCPRAIPFRREASVIFTSGSTGEPRGLIHTVGNYIYSALGTNEFIGITSADRWLVSLPLFHVGGVLIWMRTLLAGGASILPASLKNIDRAIAEFQPSVLSLVPAQLIRLLDNPEMAAICKACRAILLGGAPSPAWLIEKALDMGLPIITSYGSTEGCAQVTGVAIGSPREDYNTAGHPLAHHDIRIDSDGSIMLGGKTIFKRYLENDKSSHLRKDGYFKTADAGRFDSNGNLVCLGRRDGVFISGGENIQPFEIENQLLALENIAEAFVVPVEHHEFGKVPWAFVVAAEPVNEAALIAALKKSLPGYKVPKRIIRLDPREKKEKMKYSRSELTALAAQMANSAAGSGHHPPLF